MICAISVSYTHLDVYKRQLLRKGIVLPGVTANLIRLIFEYDIHLVDLGFLTYLVFFK